MSGLPIDRSARHSLPPGVAIKLAQLEPMVAGSRWREIRDAIQPHLNDDGGLTPELALLYALALQEAPRAGDLDGNRLGIEATAALLGVPEKSPIAILIGKRLLRKGRTGVGHTPAPRWPLSLLIAVLGIAVGLGVGWLVTFFVF